jgi:aldehyde dehydrogenase (NAD+)
LFCDVPHDAEIFQQEIFGPVVIVNIFKPEEEVIHKANTIKYNLMAGIFAQDINRALRLSSTLESGMIGVNLVSRYLLNVHLEGLNRAALVVPFERGRSTALHLRSYAPE